MWYVGRVLRAWLQSAHLGQLREDNGSSGPDGTPRSSRPTSLGGRGSSQPGKISPALPAAVSISLAVLVAIFSWRCYMLFRRPRRAAVLAKLGFVRRPRLFEVQAIPARHAHENGSTLGDLFVSTSILIESDP